MRSRTCAALLYLLTAAVCFGANDRATISGKVVDDSGKPVDHATVLVYKAGTKKGFSVYCPTCWVDCGKHTISDSDGNYRISGLNPELWFTVVALRDGYSPSYVDQVDPAAGPAKSAVLKVRQPVGNPAQVVRGKVVDAHGDPLKDAIVEQQGVHLPNGSSRFGPGGWIDEMAVTNQNGEFEIAYKEPALGMILEVDARAMAPKLFTENTGDDRKTMVVTEGATVRGRLIYEGKPVANAEVGLRTHSNGAGTAFPEQSIGTREDGTFAITNVPAGRIWFLYPKMESLTSRNIGSDVVLCVTKDDGQNVSVGDIALKPAFRLKGRVTLIDGNAIPSDMHVSLFADRSSDSQIAPIARDGSFEFQGLPTSVYSIEPGVKGYQLPPGTDPEILVDHDVSDFAIQLQKKPDRRAY